jgi:hypothetical protein
MSTQTILTADMALLGSPHQAVRSGAERRNHAVYTGTCEPLEGEGERQWGRSGDRSHDVEGMRKLERNLEKNGEILRKT